LVRLGAIRRRRISFGRASSLSHLKRLARGHLPELQPLQLCLDPLPSLAHRDPVVAVRDPVRLAQVYVGALVVEGGRKRGGAKGPEAPVQRKDVAKVGKPVAKDLGRNGLAVKALVLLGLLLRPAHDLSPVGELSWNRHTAVPADGEDATVGLREHHLSLLGLLHGEDRAVLAANPDARYTVVRGLPRVLHLKDPPLRTKRRHGEVVSAAHAAHGDASLLFP